MDTILVTGTSYSNVNYIKCKTNDERFAFFKHIATRDDIIKFWNGTLTFDNITISIHDGNQVTVTNNRASTMLTYLNPNTLEKNTTFLPPSGDEKNSRNSVMNCPTITSLKNGDEVKFEVFSEADNLANIINFNLSKANIQDSIESVFSGVNKTVEEHHITLYKTLTENVDIGLCYMQISNVSLGNSVTLEFRLTVNGERWI